MFWEELEGNWEEIDIQDQVKLENKEPGEETTRAQNRDKCRFIANMAISSMLLSILVGAVLFFVASEELSMVPSSQRKTFNANEDSSLVESSQMHTDTIRNISGEEHHFIVHNVSHKSENEKYNQVHDTPRSETSVLTNQIYEDEEARYSSSLYQKLMGRRGKVESKKYQPRENEDGEKGLGFFRQLLNAKIKMEDGILVQMTDIFESAVRSEALILIKEAIRTILDTVLHAIFDGFLPTVDRVRREADGEKRTYLDMLYNLVGAVVGRQRCGDVIACRMGKWFQGRLPAAQLVVMMVESVVPASLLQWFGVVKKSVIDRSDNCDLDYECSLQDD